MPTGTTCLKTLCTCFWEHAQQAVGLHSVVCAARYYPAPTHHNNGRFLCVYILRVLIPALHCGSGGLCIGSITCAWQAASWHSVPGHSLHTGVLPLVMCLCLCRVAVAVGVLLAPRGVQARGSVSLFPFCQVCWCVVVAVGGALAQAALGIGQLWCLQEQLA